MNFKTAAVQRLPEETFLYLFSLSTQQQKFLDKSNVKAFADDYQEDSETEICLPK